MITRNIGEIELVGYRPYDNNSDRGFKIEMYNHGAMVKCPYVIFSENRIEALTQAYNIYEILVVLGNTTMAKAIVEFTKELLG